MATSEFGRTHSVGRIRDLTAMARHCQGTPYRTAWSARPSVQSLNGIAWWAVMIFVWIAGIELDLKKAWVHRRESAITAGLALATPLLLGSMVAAGMSMYDGWIGPTAMTWQFVLGVGMACAVTALPILILLMEKLEILRQPIGQRILRYAALMTLPSGACWP